MSQSKRRVLESTVALLQKRYGAQAIKSAAEVQPPKKPGYISTGFAALDAITGCNGLPLGALTLLSGAATSGIVTLAYKALLHAQQSTPKTWQFNVAILDLTDTFDADYVARCGIDLERLLVIRPQLETTTIDLILDLVKSGELRALLIDSLPDLTRQPAAYRHLNARLPALLQLLRPVPMALIVIDEIAAPWRRLLNLDRSWQVRQQAALHIELRRERWLTKQNDLVGYRAEATVIKSEWTHQQPTAPMEIIFNGVVKAGKTGEL